MKMPGLPQVRFDLWNGPAASHAFDPQAPLQRYAFLDGSLVSNTPLTDFEPLRLEPSAESGTPISVPPQQPWHRRDSLQTIFEDHVMLGDVALDVECLASSRCLRLHGPAAEFEVDRSGGHIRARLLDGNPRGLRAFLGASWVVAATFCDWLLLHAGAVARDGRAVGFLGVSGAGKSTLTQALSDRHGRRTVADDMLPCSLSAEGHGFQVSARFPQPSLGSRGAELLDIPMPRLPLDALIFLSPARRDRPLRLQTLGRSNALGLLLSSVVGLRWMDSELVSKVLELLSRLTAEVPCYRLIYPHSPSALLMVDQIVDEL